MEERARVGDLCRELIAIASPTGAEGPLARFLAEKMRELGYRVRIDSLGNVLGVIDGGLPGPRILIDSHLDTVAVAEPEAWSVAPFGARRVGDRIYGRGASDMKGALAASVLAGADVAEALGSFPGEIWISGTVAEEVFEGVAAGSVAESVRPDVVVVGESTGLRVNRGGRGRAEITVTIRGRSAHSSNPSRGDNAVYRMVDVVRALRTMPAPEDPILGAGIAELTDIISSPYPGASVVPERCTATYDRRLLPGETAEGVLARFREAVGDPRGVEVAVAVEKMRTWTGEEIGAERFFPAWICPEHADHLVAAVAALEARGLFRGTGTYSFCTNAAHWAGRAGIPTLGYGPSQEEIAHIVDEFIEIDELIESHAGYRALLEGLLLG